MKALYSFILILSLFLSACAPSASAPAPDLSHVTLVLTHGTLIDGSGAEPVSDATVVIGDGRILSVGAISQENLQKDMPVIDLAGAYILPGFINAHVHDAYDEGRLQAWAQAGVTTVRDEGIISGPGQLKKLLSLRDQWAASPKNARLVSSGYMLTVPGGYGNLYVTSAVNARQQVNMEAQAGVDLIKLTMETGYAGVTNLPVFSDEELKLIVAAAHEHGLQVTAHITDVKFLSALLAAGVDDLAHIPLGIINPDKLQQMIDQDLYVVSTITVDDAYGAVDGAIYTLRALNRAGIKIAMGNDYTLVPQNDYDHFELGMPMHEITLMNEARMTPMQIIVASTKNAAHVCGLENELGTLEVGKLADILIINGDPLQDLNALTEVKMVIHSGEIIRQ